MEESEHEEEEDAEDEIAAELEDDAWIQCEREECLKWHRVNNEIAEKYENENWYCELNPDKQLNRLIVERRVPDPVLRQWRFHCRRFAAFLSN